MMEIHALPTGLAPFFRCQDRKPPPPPSDGRQRCLPLYMIRVGDDTMALEGNGRLAGQAALRYDFYIASRSSVLDR